MQVNVVTTTKFAADYNEGEKEELIGKDGRKGRRRENGRYTRQVMTKLREGGRDSGKEREIATKKREKR